MFDGPLTPAKWKRNCKKEPLQWCIYIDKALCYDTIMLNRNGITPNDNSLKPITTCKPSFTDPEYKFSRISIHICTYIILLLLRRRIATIRKAYIHILYPLGFILCIKMYRQLLAFADHTTVKKPIDIRLYTSIMQYQYFYILGYVYIPPTATPRASYQIRKNAGRSCAGNSGNVFPATDLKGNRELAIVAYITARSWPPSVKKIMLISLNLNVRGPN